ncbi:uncharacterized protein LOC107826966 [Nicotiana tabacum]|uniref:Proline-rich protein PRCC-like n=3 Tax=Nicotiana TaxID=4085 RepID=A0A1S4D7Y3_TOBAC|nr:PREDICTED: proline-rich protein PRCC [Nicotiana sylvestris]XP_016509497.1 PREDICTED: proline-rich protein PRCC-like [Nicotiana tabacum]
MESLFANYASSDEDDEQSQQDKHLQQQVHSSNSSNPSVFSSSLPPPKSSFSLPPPKSQSNTSPNLTTRSAVKQHFEEEDEFPDKPSSFFSSLPQPSKSTSSSSSSSLFSVLPPPKTTPLSSSDPKPKKKVVQFKPPANPFSVKSNNSVDEDEDDDDEGEKEKQRKRSESFTQTPSVKSFLSSIPAPKNSTSLGVLGSGSGRRSTIEADVPVPNSATSSEVLVSSNTGYNENQQVDGSLESSMGGIGGPTEYSASLGVAGDYSSNWGAHGYVNPESCANDGTSGYENYPGYDSNSGTYTGYEQYDHKWTDGSSTTASASAITDTAEVALTLPGKRGRKDVPQKFVEVNQDELMKNRPREDQSRLTGIAFGPSYQPVSSKGKPSKLLKRKHQISTLYFDMKQKEMELQERRAKGMLTKAQTQGKYGW